MDESARRFWDSLRKQPSTMSTVNVAFNVYSEMLKATTIPREVIKWRADIFNPDFETSDVWSHFEEWTDFIADFVAERRGVCLSSMEAMVLSELLWAGAGVRFAREGVVGT